MHCTPSLFVHLCIMMSRCASSPFWLSMGQVQLCMIPGTTSYWTTQLAFLWYWEPIKWRTLSTKVVLTIWGGQVWWPTLNMLNSSVRLVDLLVWYGSIWTTLIMANPLPIGWFYLFDKSVWTILIIVNLLAICWGTFALRWSTYGMHQHVGYI
jgi:hypothetical protein